MVVPPGLDLSKTTRERYKEHSDEPDCRGCHEKIDPIGFGFSHFDGIGIYQTMEAGKPIDASGAILASKEIQGSFSGAHELARLLVQSPYAQSCFVKQWLRFSYGTRERGRLACLIPDLQKEFAAKELRLRDLLVAFTQTQHFRQRFSILPDPQIPAEIVEEPIPDGGGNNPEPPPPNQLSVRVDEQTRWDTGYCVQVYVTNNGTSDIEWSISLKVEGEITQLWNAVSADKSPTEKDFSGVDWNRTLQPQQTTNFGWCASL
jgi:cellulase/cellobiase CelA1